MNAPTDLPGPYETEQQTYGEPLPKRVDAINKQAFADRTRLPARLQLVKFSALADACQEAGVAVGAYDRRILGWLAKWEPATVQVVIGLIARAHAAGWAAASAEDGG